MQHRITVEHPEHQLRIVRTNDNHFTINSNGRTWGMDRAMAQQLQIGLAVLLAPGDYTEAVSKAWDAAHPPYDPLRALARLTIFPPAPKPEDL